MEESVIYQEITATAKAQGLQQSAEREQALILRQLQRQVGILVPDVRSQLESLPLEQLEALAEALLDFSSEADLEEWLQNNA